MGPVRATKILELLINLCLSNEAHGDIADSNASMQESMQHLEDTVSRKQFFAHAVLKTYIAMTDTMISLGEISTEQNKICKDFYNTVKLHLSSFPGHIKLGKKLESWNANPTTSIPRMMTSQTISENSFMRKALATRTRPTAKENDIIMIRTTFEES